MFSYVEKERKKKEKEGIWLAERNHLKGKQGWVDVKERQNSSDQSEKYAGKLVMKQRQ